MRAFEWLLVATFAFLTLLAWIKSPGARARGIATAVGVVGVGLTLGARFSGQVVDPVIASVIRDWIPAPLMLVVYWQAGFFFTAPNARLQRRFDEVDRSIMKLLPEANLARVRSRWVTGGLELSYLFCYLLVPMGIAVLYLSERTDFVDRYWIVVLSASCLCYAVVPFIQVLPPRLMSAEGNPGPMGFFRRVNLWLLRNASIQANTFPSAHVASTMSASLVLISAVPPAGLGFLCIALLIAVASVAGRYHYAIDAITGAGLAVIACLVAVWTW